MRVLSAATRPPGAARLLVVASGLLASLAVAACGAGDAAGDSDAKAGADGGGASAAPPPTARFEEGGIAFDYPAAWKVVHVKDAGSKAVTVIAYLGTTAVHEPCTGSGSSMRCGAAYELAPGEVALAVTSFGSPDFDILEVPPAAEPILADWLPGYRETTGPDPDTGADGGATWTLPVPGSVDTAYRLVLQTREPGGAAAVEAVDAIVESLMYHPPAPPLPDGTKAADAAMAAAIASLAADDPAWACFSPGGSTASRVEALPGGPKLKKPRQAACSASIEATALRLWRARLTLRLAEPDPAAGHGVEITLWIRVDGSPGSWRSTPLDATPQPQE